MRRHRSPIGRELGHRGLRIWRELYGEPPPGEGVRSVGGQPDAAAAQQSTDDTSNSQAHSVAKQDPCITQVTQTQSKFGAPSPLVAHLLPAEPELASTSQGASR